jgi:GNAT superfamily N-acetyltransferase
MRNVEIHPLTPDRWADFEKLFGPRGAYGGCWCMFWRLRSRDNSRNAGPDNRREMKNIVDSGEAPGLVVYVEGEPAGWCSIDPREKFLRIEHSRTLTRVDDRGGVWSLNCFVIGKEYRRLGLMTALLDAAIEYARERGANIIEAYPIEPGGDLKSYHGYTGIASTFRRRGFREVARPRPSQAMMRMELRSDIGVLTNERPGDMTQKTPRTASGANLTSDS